MARRGSSATFGLTELDLGDAEGKSAESIAAAAAAGAAPSHSKPGDVGGSSDGAVDGGMAMDIMMLLDTAEVLALKREFEKQEDGLTCAQPVCAR